MIINIEGTDGSGKRTQAELLLKDLESHGKKCRLISFPNYESGSSAPVKMYLNGDLGNSADCIDGYQASTIFAVDRLITMHNINIEDYDYLILDRYVPSNMIHQSTRINNLKDLDIFLDWVQDFEYNKLKLPIPDKIIFLDVPISISIKLAHARTELKNGQAHDVIENDDNQLRIAYERAKYVAKRNNWITINCTDNEKIKSIDQIHDLIMSKLGF